MSEPYRPANASEGLAFMAQFCDRCDRLYCEIKTNAMIYDVDDPSYPEEWIYDDESPTCTAFTQEAE